jgi:RNA polymerase sigma-70 factor (ECF subfamily)
MRLFAALLTTSSFDDDETGAQVDAEAQLLFDLLYTEQRSKVTAYCWRLTGAREVAEDLTQDTFEYVWKHRNVLVTRSQPVWWLFQVASHKTIDYVRRRRTWERLERLWLPLQRRHDASLERQVEARELITWAILQLPPNQRQAWVLCELHGFSYLQIAHILAQKEETIRTWLYRARQQLKAWMGDDDNTEEEGRGERP